MTRSHVLVLFMDGVGLGPADPSVNPFAVARTPALSDAFGGRRLLLDSAPCHGPSASLLAIDACLDVPGDPQSATGQAALLTGRNISAEVGGHYGPKPSPPVAARLREGSLFSEVLALGGSAALLNAYPPRYFEYIASGRRLYSSIPMAATNAGVSLMTAEDLQAGRALSADFTGKGWAEQPGFPPAPIYGRREAGALLARLARAVDMAWFDFWPSDVAGHRADLHQAVHLVEHFDEVLGGLIGAWDGHQDLVLITSDHGNLEDLSERGHTRNPVPGILIGPSDLRAAIAPRLSRLTDFHDVILDVIFGDGRSPASAPSPRG
jgi:hypothetical protein